VTARRAAAREGEATEEFPPRRAARAVLPHSARGGGSRAGQEMQRA